MLAAERNGDVGDRTEQNERIVLRRNEAVPTSGGFTPWPVRILLATCSPPAATATTMPSPVPAMEPAAMQDRPTRT